MTSAYSDWIGRTKTGSDDWVTPRLTTHFNATFGEALYPELDTPLGLHWCLCHDAVPTDQLAHDGHPAKGDFLPPVPLPRRMWAGGEIEYLGPIAAGDRISKSSRIESVIQKQGRSGPLCFVAVRIEYSTVNGVAVRELHNIVYRDTAPSHMLPAHPCAPMSDFQSDVVVNEVMLFRFSALTFNGHRIHYDLNYSQKVEGYRDLVIHGPLQATLLLNFAAKSRGVPPNKFTFTATAPATGAQIMKLSAQNTDHGLDLLMQSAEGVGTMQAKAYWETP